MDDPTITSVFGNTFLFDECQMDMDDLLDSDTRTMLDSNTTTLDYPVHSIDSNTTALDYPVHSIDSNTTASMDSDTHTMLDSNTNTLDYPVHSMTDTTTSVHDLVAEMNNIYNHKHKHNHTVSCKPHDIYGTPQQMIDIVMALSGVWELPECVPTALDTLFQLFQKHLLKIQPSIQLNADMRDAFISGLHARFIRCTERAMQLLDKFGLLDVFFIPGWLAEPKATVDGNNSMWCDAVVKPITEVVASMHVNAILQDGMHQRMIKQERMFSCKLYVQQLWEKRPTQEPISGGNFRIEHAKIFQFEVIVKHKYMQDRNMPYSLLMIHLGPKMVKFAKTSFPWLSQYIRNDMDIQNNITLRVDYA